MPGGICVERLPLFLVLNEEMYPKTKIPLCEGKLHVSERIGVDTTFRDTAVALLDGKYLVFSTQKIDEKKYSTALDITGVVERLLQLKKVIASASAEKKVEKTVKVKSLDNWLHSIIKWSTKGKGIKINLYVAELGRCEKVNEENLELQYREDKEGLSEAEHNTVQIEIVTMYVDTGVATPIKTIISLSKLYGGNGTAEVDVFTTDTNTPIKIERRLFSELRGTRLSLKLIGIGDIAIARKLMRCITKILDMLSYVILYDVM